MSKIQIEKCLKNFRFASRKYFKLFVLTRFDIYTNQVHKCDPDL